MNKQSLLLCSKNKILIILFWSILLILSLKLGTNLRLLGYNNIPEPYIILDEHTNVWHGVSLRKTGIPAAWSILGFYVDQSKITGAGGRADGFNLSVDEVKPTLKNYSNFPKPVIGVHEFDFGRGFSHTRLVQPYLDHPPFGAYILGLFVSNDSSSFEEVNNFDLRQASLYLGVITQFLIFMLALIITKKPFVGLVASTIYGTVPSYLLLSRYALLENVLSPILLLTLIILIFANNLVGINKNNNLINYLLVIAGAIAGLGALTKLVGWIFILSGAVLLYLWKFNWKQIIKFLIPAIVIGSIYFAWGIYLSPRLFVDLFLAQGSRDFIGSINLLVTFFRVNIYRFPLDGWWIGGFISLFFIPKEKKYLPIGVSVFSILFSALAIVGSNYPWYFIPLIPFMAIATALLFHKFMSKPSLTLTFIIFFSFVSSSFYWGYSVWQKFQPFNLYRLLFLVFVLIGSFWFFVHKKSKYNKIWTFGVVVLLLVLVMLNRRSMIFILENWGKLPLIYTPGTF